MYHYTECGLNSVYLLNGYYIRQTKGGEAVAVEDVDGLHRLIGKVLVQQKAHLSGPEFRFLRKELGLSQERLGQIIGCQGQTVALWEKRGRVNKQADRWIRALYRECTEGNARLCESVQLMNELDRLYHEIKMEFRKVGHSNGGGGWEPKVA